jgi:hypothetical protein
MGGSPMAFGLADAIISDNPINQTILSTFMKKKQIKYDVAKNGQEAVQKWRTGGFHLILVCIEKLDWQTFHHFSRWTYKCLSWTGYRQQKKYDVQRRKMHLLAILH